jgi:mono/diheme cytochrome c family protein
MGRATAHIPKVRPSRDHSFLLPVHRFLHRNGDACAETARHAAVRFLLAASVLLLGSLSGASRAPAQAAPKTTADGVYTAAQAKSGGDLYTMLCQSCHAAITHTGTPFRAKWVGRTLADLYTYIREEMPKTEPGSLSEEEYTLVLAYILRMNGMPAGRRALDPADGSMTRIRIDMPVGEASLEEGASRPHGVSLPSRPRP